MLILTLVRHVSDLGPYDWIKLVDVKYARVSYYYRFK